jgi:hypothetical protein
MRNKKLSVVIVSYNNLGVIKDCLDSVYAFNDIGDNLEVIVVENSPTNEIYEVLKKDYPKAIIIKNKNNGFGEGNNVGVRASSGEYLLFLNPDTILVEEIFSFAVMQFENDERLGLFGLKLVDINRKSNMSFYFYDNVGVVHSILIKLLNRLNIFIDGKMFIAGANIFIRKNLFLEIGMFDESIFMYCEEADLTRRLKKKNMKCKFFSKKSIIHLEGKTNTNNEIALRRRMKSKYYYCNKHNIDFRSRVLQERRYYYFKAIILLLLFNKRLYRLNIVNAEKLNEFLDWRK